MYDLTPIISTKTIYNCIFKVKKEDSKKILDNLELLIGEYEIDVNSD